MLTTADIVSLEFELIVYRKGSLHAHVNLERGYLTWRDSWQWGNNFTRTITAEQVSELLQLIEKCNLQASRKLSTDPGDLSQRKTPDQPDFDPVSWLITVNQAEDTWQVRGYGDVPECWQPLKDMIEKVSRICFFV